MLPWRMCSSAFTRRVVTGADVKQPLDVFEGSADSSCFPVLKSSLLKFKTQVAL